MFLFLHLYLGLVSTFDLHCEIVCVRNDALCSRYSEPFGAVLVWYAAVLLRVIRTIIAVLCNWVGSHDRLAGHDTPYIS